jgi:hypothetical protein
MFVNIISLNKYLYFHDPKKALQFSTMKKRLITLLTLTLISNCIFAQSKITTFNASYLSSITEMAVGTDNSLYLAGEFVGFLSLGNKTYVSRDGEQFFCKMDTAGNICWFNQNTFYVRDIQVFDNQIYLLCQYNKTVTLNGITSKSGNYNFFLAAYGTDGSFKWMKGAESSEAGIFPTKLSVDPEGNAYILCSYDGPVAIGAQKLEKVNDKNAFIAKYDKSGNLKWVSTFSGGNSFITGIWANCVYYSDPQHIYVCGQISGNCDFVTNNITTKKYKFDNGAELYRSEVFVATFTNEGICTSVKSLITEANCLQMCTDASGNLVLGGYFTGKISEDDYATSFFGGQPIKATIDPIVKGPSEDAYVAEFNSDGQLLWVARSKGGSTERINSLAVSSDGNIYACGYAERETGFSGKTKKTDLIAVNGSGEEKNKGDIFIVKLTSDGELDWFKTGGGIGADYANCLVAGNKNIYSGGYFSGNITFDGINTMLSGFSFNAAIIKM